MVTNAPAGTTNLTFTVATNSAYFARVTASSGSGLFATYLLGIDLLDSVGPAVTGLTLPAAGTTNLAILDRFSITVNKDLDPAFAALNRTIRFYNGNAYFLTDNSTSWLNAQLTAMNLRGVKESGRLFAAVHQSGFKFADANRIDSSPRGGGSL